MPEPISHADLTEPMVREIIAAFEAPQEGHELAQKLERVWPVMKRALLASISQPQADLTERARECVEAFPSYAFDRAHTEVLVKEVAAALQSKRLEAANNRRLTQFALIWFCLCCLCGIGAATVIATAIYVLVRII